METASEIITGLFCSEPGCVNLAYLGGLCKDHLVLILKRKLKDTDIVVYSAWVPVDTLLGPHKTITFVEGVPFGKIGSATGTEEEFELAYAEILEMYPEAEMGEKDAGEIVLSIEENS